MAFSVLSDAQGAELRDRIGDTDTTSPDLSDSVLDNLYTSAVSDLDLATVYAIRRRLGILANSVDVTDSNHLITERRKQRFDNLKSLLDLWEGIAGVGEGELQMGSIDLNLDTDAADLDLV